jgi:hypothetical protein
MGIKPPLRCGGIVVSGPHEVGRLLDNQQNRFAGKFLSRDMGGCEKDETKKRQGNCGGWSRHC